MRLRCWHLEVGGVFVGGQNYLAVWRTAFWECMQMNLWWNTGVTGMTAPAPVRHSSRTEHKSLSSTGKSDNSPKVEKKWEKEKPIHCTISAICNWSKDAEGHDNMLLQDSESYAGNTHRSQEYLVRPVVIYHTVFIVEAMSIDIPAKLKSADVSMAWLIKKVLSSSSDLFPTEKMWRILFHF